MAKKQKKTRIEVPSELAATVLFASDRTCCVCRSPDRKVEIHHIDGVPSNNVFSNLAVVCKDCQSDAHTIEAFARNLTPELVRLYNSSWRSIVASRLNPGSSAEECAYRGAALGDIACTIRGLIASLRMIAHRNGHAWIITTRFGPGYEEELQIDYSRANWENYRAIFIQYVPKLMERLERLMLLYADAISVGLKSEIMTLSRVLSADPGQYEQIPSLESNPRMKGGNLEGLFQFRFAGLMGMIKRAEAIFQTAYDAATQQLETLTKLSSQK